MEMMEYPMKQTKQILQKYLSYCQERFPIAGALLYAGSLFYVSYLSGNLFINHLPIDLSHSLLGVLVIFFVLLHLRLWDEHKDYEKDRIAHPDRMLSKGLITLQDLRKLLYVVVFLEAGMSIYLGMYVFIWWVIIMIWSYLMAVEFYCPEFLIKRIGLYLISHQLIVPIIVIYGLIQRVTILNSSMEEVGLLIMLCIGCICSTITYEIARKTWSKEQEHEYADSYTKFWGINLTLIINQLTAFLACISFSFIYYLTPSSPLFIFTTFLLYLLFLSASIRFATTPSKSNSKFVEMTGIIFLLGLFLNASIGFYRI